MSSYANHDRGPGHVNDFMGSSARPLPPVVALLVAVSGAVPYLRFPTRNKQGVNCGGSSVPFLYRLRCAFAIQHSWYLFHHTVHTGRDGRTRFERAQN
jgi:hypothetical protein